MYIEEHTNLASLIRVALARHSAMRGVVVGLDLVELVQLEGKSKKRSPSMITARLCACLHACTACLRAGIRMQMVETRGSSPGCKPSFWGVEESRTECPSIQNGRLT